MGAMLALAPPEGDPSLFWFNKALLELKAAAKPINPKDDSVLWGEVHAFAALTVKMEINFHVGDERAELAQTSELFHSALLGYNRPEDTENRLKLETSLVETLEQELAHTPAPLNRELLLQEAEAYRDVLTLKPANAAEVLTKVDNLYQNRLMDFQKSYEFRSEQPSASDPFVLWRLAEADFTTSRFKACDDRLQQILDENKEVSGAMFGVGAFRILYTACQWGAGNKEQVMKATEMFVLVDGADKKNIWKTEGDRKYLETAPEFALGRPLWIELFRALQQGDSAAMEKSGKELSALLRQ